MIKLTCSIFISSNIFLYIFSFLAYIKKSKDSSAKFYQNSNERLQKISKSS